MSLHLGNLSPRIRKDELEHVFRRFGRCTVQLKDGYGFAVFDFRGDAEKALRSLKGRKICGQLIYLSWSNKQPKPLKSFLRASKSRDMRHGRISGRVDNSVRRNFYGSHEDYTMSNKRPDDGGARHRTMEVHDDGGSFRNNEVELERYHQKEEFLQEDSYVKPNHVDNGRWSEQFDNSGDTNCGDAHMVFDRYEPDCVDERENYESHSLGNAEGSPIGKTLRNKSNKVHHDSVRGHYTCFKCGDAGHKMRDCPLKDSLHGKSLYRSGLRNDDETDCRSVKDEVGGPQSRSRGRVQPRSRNSRSSRRHEANEKPSLAERNETNYRSSPSNVSNRIETKDCNRKRQRERDNQIVEMLDDKKSGRLPSSHRHSKNTSPHLGTHLKSVRPSSGSISSSRSGSPVQHSLTPKSRSKKGRDRSRFRSIKSKSRSGSSSPSSSLSISHDRLLPSSMDKVEVNLNGSFEGVPNSLLKDKLTAVRQEYVPLIGNEKISTENNAEAGFSGSIDNSSCQLEEDLTEQEQLELDLKDENAISANCAELSMNGSLVDQIPQSWEESLVERQQLEPELRKNSLQIGDVPGRIEDISSASGMQVDMEMNQSCNDNCSSFIVPQVSCDIKIPCPSVELRGKDTTAQPPSADKLREVEERGNRLEEMKYLEPAYKSDPKAPFEAHIGCNMRISAEELCKVMKHYGLEHPKKDEQNLGAEDYFGSARLWPWALIYYRRLKKGPVSAENYARRVAQNKAFGITDKYIRSSSGWCESVE